MNSDFPLAHTHATKMLRAALDRLHREKGISIRGISPALGYKGGVVLSHMALGRVPIPIDRSLEIARVLEMNELEFVGAVLLQRYPDLPWDQLLNSSLSDEPAGDVTSDLEGILDAPVSTLNPEQRRVIREVASDPRPLRRWLTVHELPVLQLLREIRPAFPIEGLSLTERQALRRVLEAGASHT